VDRVCGEGLGVVDSFINGACEAERVFGDVEGVSFDFFSEFGSSEGYFALSFVGTFKVVASVGSTVFISGW